MRIKWSKVNDSLTFSVPEWFLSKGYIHLRLKLELSSHRWQLNIVVPTGMLYSLKTNSKEINIWTDKNHKGTKGKSWISSAAEIRFS
jgi:hypothetical protein